MACQNWQNWQSKSQPARNHWNTTCRLEMTSLGAGLGSANPKSHTLSNRKTLCNLWPNDALVWHCLASRHATTTTDTPTQLALCRYVSVPNQTLPGLLPSATTIVSLLLHNATHTSPTWTTTVTPTRLAKYQLHRSLHPLAAKCSASCGTIAGLVPSDHLAWEHRTYARTYNNMQKMWHYMALWQIYNDIYNDR